MVRLTLDTNCWIEVRDAHPCAALVELVEMSRTGLIELRAASALERDVRRDPDSARGERTRKTVSRHAGPARSPGPFRLDVSTFDGHDTFVADDDLALIRCLEAALDVGPGRGEKALADVDHLIAHARDGADVFVTRDRDFLGRVVRGLIEACGILVMEPREAVAFVRKALAKDF